MQTLLRLIHPIFPVTDAFECALTERLRPVAAPRHSWLLQPGEISRHVYFVEEGLIRGYYLKEGRDITSWFMRENDFVLSPVSFFTRQPSTEYLETLEDTRLHGITFDHLEELYDLFPGFNKVGRRLVQEYYVRSELRAQHLRANTAEERYQQFLRTYRPLLNRVANQHIASFLGLTPETLSRIRGKLR